MSGRNGALSGFAGVGQIPLPCHSTDGRLRKLDELFHRSHATLCRVRVWVAKSVLSLVLAIQETAKCLRRVYSDAMDILQQRDRMLVLGASGVLSKPAAADHIRCGNPGRDGVADTNGALVFIAGISEQAGGFRERKGRLQASLRVTLGTSGSPGSQVTVQE